MYVNPKHNELMILNKSYMAKKISSINTQNKMLCINIGNFKVIALLYNETIKD